MTRMPQFKIPKKRITYRMRSVAEGKYAVDAITTIEQEIAILSSEEKANELIEKRKNAEARGSRS